MSGVLTHLLMTLRLHARSPQSLVLGYLVPVLFLVAFAAAFGSSPESMQRSLGKVLTIAVLGGACFGMPIALVAERERGVWRRYRLAPIGGWWLVASTLLARTAILLVSGALVVAVAMAAYGMPLPAHPFALLAAYLVACIAFLGVGLVLAMAVSSVPAVQALGQCLFLPMLIVGGVAMPMRLLPEWAQGVARFTPGRYAVQLMDQATIPGIASGYAWFPVLVLLATGACGIGAAVAAFRWGAEPVRPRTTLLMVAGALVPWIVAGLVATWGFGS